MNVDPLSQKVISQTQFSKEEASQSTLPNTASSLEKMTINPIMSLLDASITVTSSDSKNSTNVPSIPLIDLEVISQWGSDGDIMIQKFGDGLRDVGFIAVKAPDYLNELIKKVNSEMADYFHQPLEEKMKDWKNNNGQTGFSPQGSETAAGAKKADIKETYFIPPNFKEWPKNRPNFEITMSAYHKELTDIAMQLMACLAEYLGQETEDVTTSMNAAYNLIRLAYYPAASHEDDPEAVWAAAHEDLNALTLLPPSTIPGLQLLTKEGEWLPVVVPDGYLIVNTGEQLQRKTAGLIKATRHQVVNPGGQYQYQERFASIFFASWSETFRLKPFEQCFELMTGGLSSIEKEKYQKQYPDVNVDENLMSRLIEMGTIKDPSVELLTSLLSKGLLTKPPELTVKQHPELFF